MGVSTWLKLFTPATKVLGAAKEIQRKTIPFIVYKQLNISGMESDFDSIFNQAIYEFETTHPSHHSHI